MAVVDAPTSKTITGHKNVREALRDTATYSSDLQGDADVRDYRQLPLEVDPPRHHLYRAALSQFFVKPAVEKFRPQFLINSKETIENYFATPGANVVSTLALPLIMKNLGTLYSREEDVAEWISWGPDVWTAAGEKRDGGVLHNYLDRIYEEAMIGAKDDIWREIAHLEIEGKQISPIEFRGIASVMLAGGRDTVVKLFTAILWHFARVPADYRALQKEPELIAGAIQEFLRYFSPIPLMARTTTPESGATNLPADRYVGISFISGNFDESVFENPTELNIRRERNPHLAFGFGPHTCLGNHITEVETRAYIETLLDMNLDLSVVSEEITYYQPPLPQVPLVFESLVLRRS